MFCLMDVSASMTEPLKDLAKRFFMLLYLFLTREYEAVEVVFIRHTTTAREVDEEAFFRGTDTGGTVVSTALEKMQEILAARYPVSEWNVYAAQASDGHDFTDDLGICQSMLHEMLPQCQYYAYVEVSAPHMMSGSDSPLWGAYAQVADSHENFAMRHISAPDQILPVFRGAGGAGPRRAGAARRPAPRAARGPWRHRPRRCSPARNGASISSA